MKFKEGQILEEFEVDGKKIVFRRLKSSIFEHIEVFYNRVRKHSRLGYLSPYQFELQKELQKVA